MNIGVILAAGKGTRLKCTDKNKTTLALHGKPLIQYGIDLYRKSVDEIVVVVGAFSDSVKQVIEGNSLHFADQTEQKGTGHAAKVAVEEIVRKGMEPEHVFVGYGDHMMFYTSESISEMLKQQLKNDAVMTLVSVKHEDPNMLAWGRIIRNEDGTVAKIVEQKDASEEERAVTELNAGFYCFNFAFLKEAVQRLLPSPVTDEYYITDLVEIAREMGKKVAAYSVPFTQVGTGINTFEQLEMSEHMMEI